MVSENKRDLNTVQAEYTQACADLGNLVYRNSALASEIEMNEGSIEKLQKKMKKLNQEGSDLTQASQKAAIEAASAGNASA